MADAADAEVVELDHRGAQVNGLLPPDRPDVVVFPRTEAEVAAVVRDAATNGQRVAVRSGGHSWAATSLRDGGVLVDLRHLDGAEIDAAGLRARVRPGLRGGRLATLLTDAGVAFPVGHCGDPGIGGYLLGGGLGLNWGAWGPAVSSIESVRLVTAAGDVIVASREVHPDWFWLVRGAGPTLPAIVTEFTLRLRPLPRDIRVSAWTYDQGDVAEVAGWLREASRHLPPEVELPVVLAGPRRPGAGQPPFTIGVTAIAFTDDEAAASAALAPLGDGASALDSARLVPARFDELHEGVDATYPDGARYLADTFWTDRDLGDVVVLLAPVVRAAPSGRSYVLTSMPAHGAGKMLVDETETSLSLHDRTIVTVYAIWDDPTDDAANAAWLDDVSAVLAPITTGHFLNEADIRRRPDRVPASFSPSAWARVEDLRARFDPEGRFHTFPAPGVETTGASERS